MDCQDIKKNLKLFLEDLLVDEDYEAFCQHLSECQNCNRYVRSISCLSNQLWKMGQIKIPFDLSSAIKYKLAQSIVEQKKSQRIALKNKFITLLVLIVLIIFSFFIYKYFVNKKTKVSIKKEEIVKESLISSTNNIEDYRGNISYINQTYLQKEFELINQTLEEKKNLSNESAEVLDISSQITSKIENLHWHIKDSYSKVKSCLSSINIVLEYERNNLFIFKVAKDKLKTLLEKFALEKINFLNFTKYIDTNLVDTEYKVIIFLEDSSSRVIHWDIGQTSIEKRKEIVSLIKENSISIDYQSENFIIFSLSETQLKNLRARLEIFDISLIEFKNIDSKENIFVSGPISVSVFLY
ncbi:MAG: hypothetical protein QXZ20_01760 [Candidatus Aenigmatarchaeota archaeon]